MAWAEVWLHTMYFSLNDRDKLVSLLSIYIYYPGRAKELLLVRALFNRHTSTLAGYSGTPYLTGIPLTLLGY